MDVCDLKITCVNGQSIRWMSEETQVWTMLLLERIVAAAYLWLGEHVEEVGLRGHQKVRADPTAKTVREHCLKTQVAAACK